MIGRRFHHRLPFGTELDKEGRAQFRLWAPSAPMPPVLEIADGPATPMIAQSDGWYIAVAPAAAGTRYRFRIAPDLAVPDPAARAQADDVHGWSLVVDPGAHQWRCPEWRGRPWHETVLYELHVGAYGGDLAGVARDLDRLASLGVTAIELMPLADFPGERNWGYDGVLPFAVDRCYGGPEALKRLVDAAHGLGLMVFLDVVYNHFGPDGNYLHTYAAPFFAETAQTPWGPSIDFRRPEVRAFFIENALYWLQEYRIDGLRLDAAHAIDAAPGEHFLAELARRVRDAIGPERHVHLVLEHDENAADLLAPGLFDAQWNDDAHHALHVLLSGEHDGYYADYAEAPAMQLARCLGQGFAFQGELSPHRRGARRGQPSLHLPPTSFVTFLQNHDHVGNRARGDRRLTATDRDARRAALALVMLSPNIPMLFMGDEWASDQPFLYFTDHHPELGRAVHDGRQREFARFATFNGEPIAEPNHPHTFAASRLDLHSARAPEQAEELALHRHLLALRHRHIVPRLPGAVALGGDAIGAMAVRAAWRLKDGSVLQLLCNLGREEIRVPPCTGGCVLYASTGTAAADLAEGRLAATTTFWHLLSGRR